MNEKLPSLSLLPALMDSCCTPLPIRFIQLGIIGNPIAPMNVELREDGGKELRENNSIELREQN